MRQEEIRQKIKIVQIINRVQGFFFGELEARANAAGERKPIELTANQLAAAKLLINKALPDLSQVKVEGNGPGGEFSHTIIVREFPEPEDLAENENNG